MHKLAARDGDDPDGPPVAYISAAIYGQPSVDPDISWQWEIVGPFHAGILYFADPSRHRQGIGSAMLPALLAYPDLAEVATFQCSIEDDNVASQKVADAAGFERIPLASNRTNKTMHFYRYCRHV